MVVVDYGVRENIVGVVNKSVGDKRVEVGVSV